MTKPKTRSMEKPLNELGKLIGGRRQVNGWSYAEISRRIGRVEGVEKLSASRIQQLATEIPLPGIQRSAVIALAAGLGVSEDRVALEAMRAMGFRPPVGDVTVAEAVLRDDTLSDELRRAITAIVKASQQNDRAG